MSERLRDLRNALRAHAVDDFRELFVSGRGDEFLEGVLETVEDEIAEREAPPVLEEALVEAARELDDAAVLVAIEHNKRLFSEESSLPAARGHMERARSLMADIALRGARPATRAEWLAVALDLAQDDGEVSEGLARTVALVGGPWSDGAIGWLRSATHGPAASVLPAPGGSWSWAAFDTDNHAIGEGSVPTLRDAVLAADAALLAEGRILLGGLPPEAEIDATTVSLGEPRRVVDGPQPVSPDGDWCPSCGENIDGERFLGSKSRLLWGEIRRVCGACADDIDDQPDGSDGRWP